MKSFQMRSYYLAPLLVLAMVACAKRDNDFAKKAAEAKAAAEQLKAGTQKPTASPVPSPGASPATAAEDSDVTDPAASTTDPDAQKAEDAAKSDDKMKADAKSYEGDLTTQKSCDNHISSSPEENENAIEMRNILTSEEGTYVLQSGELFLEQQDADSDKPSNQINAIATPWTLAADQDKAEGKNLQVTCHSVDISEKSKQKVSGVLALPYDINAKTGFAKHIRRDQITLSATEKTVKSNIYVYKKAAEGFDVGAYVANPNSTNDSVKTVVTMKRVKNSTDFKLIIKTKTTSATGVSTKTVLGTYSLKK